MITQKNLAKFSEEEEDFSQSCSEFALVRRYFVRIPCPSTQRIKKRILGTLSFVIFLPSCPCQLLFLSPSFFQPIWGLGDPRRFSHSREMCLSVFVANFVLFTSMEEGWFWPSTLPERVPNHYFLSGVSLYLFSLLSEQSPISYKDFDDCYRFLHKK